MKTGDCIPSARMETCNFLPCEDGSGGNEPPRYRHMAMGTPLRLATIGVFAAVAWVLTVLLIRAAIHLVRWWI
jgi:hypothetical protein